MTVQQSQPMTVAPCKLCGKSPGQKVGPPAMARCVNSECDGPNLRALPIPEWNLENAPAYAADEIDRLRAELASARKALEEALSVIEDTVSYRHSGDPWEENAFDMGELDIHDYARDGRLKAARAALGQPK